MIEDSLETLMRYMMHKQSGTAKWMDDSKCVRGVTCWELFHNDHLSLAGELELWLKKRDENGSENP